MVLEIVAATAPSPMVRVVAFVLMAAGVGAVVWLPLALIRRFRTRKAAAMTWGCAAIATLGLMAIPRSPRSAEAIPAPDAFSAVVPTPVANRPAPTVPAEQGAAAPSTVVKATASDDKTTQPDATGAVAAASPFSRKPAKVSSPALGTPGTGPAFEGLGSPWIEQTEKFSIQFPAQWNVRRIEGKPWIVEANLNAEAFVSVGVSRVAGKQVVTPAAVAAVEAGIRGLPNTELAASGTDSLHGHPYMYFKYTGPMPMTNGAPRMTMVHYLIPLEGRTIEVRIAATPQHFARHAPVMNRAVGSIILVE